MKKLYQLIALALSAAVVAFAQNEGSIQTVAVEGTGNSAEEAVAVAVQKAVMSKCGMNVNIQKRSQITTQQESSSFSISDSLKQQMALDAKGVIQGFDVVSCERNPQSGKWESTVSVRIYGQYIVGNDPNLRRRMAISPFMTKQKTVFVAGKEFQTGVLLDMLQNSLAEQLTQTRKFTMLDRKYDTEVQAELARISGPNASQQDFGRLNQLLATDYLLCAEVTFMETPTGVLNPFTGQNTAAPNAPVCSVSYRVLLAPTGQLKWADTITIDSALAAGGRSADESAQVLMQLAASDIADGMMSNILPFLVADVDKGTGMIVLNQGGKSLSPGETMVVYTFGKEILDPMNGESLGKMEIPLGTIQITKVLPKVSYANLLSGDIGTIQIGCCVRRPDGPPPTDPPPPSGTMFRATPQGGILAPFK
ncbi:MAG: hypothetical protein IJR99_05465 [Kiritimatiellae bacterium]|nr:hypothetical protein [Kiritimatiellia bacterium]